MTAIALLAYHFITIRWVKS